jgi:hypothetical protein
MAHITPLSGRRNEMEDSEIEIIARMCHEANRVLCDYSAESFQQLPWSECPQWQKDSAMVGVKNIIEKPRATPRDSHESWLKQKVADGWVYGEVKDAEKKTHPCMVQYDKLPAKQRMKDFVFTGIVRSVMAGFVDGCKL